jgi:hypothetical protein
MLSSALKAFACQWFRGPMAADGAGATWQGWSLPMSLDLELRRRSARQAANHRWHPERPDLAADDRRALETNALERHIRKALASPTPPAQTDRMELAALLLRGGTP